MFTLPKLFRPSYTFLQIQLGKLDGNKYKVFANLLIICNILASLKYTRNTTNKRNTCKNIWNTKSKLQKPPWKIYAPLEQNQMTQ
jgi:hypothetical protein